MCLSIHPIVEADERGLVSIIFAMETIYQRRRGASFIQVDLLLKNECQFPIDRLRVLLPHRLLDISYVTKRLATNESRAKRIILSLEKKQRSLIKLKSHELTNPSDSHNWPYRLLEYLTPPVVRNGHVSVTRKYQQKGESQISGVVKPGWVIETIPEVNVDEWTWVALSSADSFAFDLTTPTANSRIELGEQAWFRLNIEVPSYDFNRKTWIELILAQSRVFRQIFRSPAAVTSHIQTMLKSAEPATFDLPAELVARATHAYTHALKLIPAADAPVKDWRTFLYREYGTRFERVAPQGEEKHIPVVLEDEEYQLPPEADADNAIREGLPPFLSWLRRHRERSDMATVLMFGTDHGTITNRYNLLVVTRARNLIYSALPWLGVVLGIVGIILAIFFC